MQVLVAPAAQHLKGNWQQVTAHAAPATHHKLPAGVALPCLPCAEITDGLEAEALARAALRRERGIDYVPEPAELEERTRVGPAAPAAPAGPADASSAALVK